MASNMSQLHIHQQTEPIPISNNASGVYYNAGGTFHPMPPPAKMARQSHVCCFCCCDTRQASMTVDVINMIFYALGIAMTVAFSGVNFFESLEDQIEFQMGTDEWSAYTWVSVVTQCVPLVFSFLGFVGAQFFVPWMVVLAACWYSLVAIVYLAIFGPVSLIMPALFAYPHIVLANEMIRGVITEETYPHESYCCCCV